MVNEEKKEESSNMWIFVVVGIVLFCGGLYLLVFVGKTAISWVTPIGGSLIILAWLYLVIHS